MHMHALKYLCVMFLSLFFLFCFLVNYAVWVVPSALYLTIYLMGIMSDVIIVFWLCCVKTKPKTMGLICNTWKELGSALCGNPTLKFGRDTHYCRWLRGRILGQRGAGFNKDIPLETQSNRASFFLSATFPVRSTGAPEIRSVFQQYRCYTVCGSSKLHTIWKGSALADGPQTI